MKRTSLTFLSLVALLIGAVTLPAAARSSKGGSTDANKALARRVPNEVFNQGNTAAIDELFTATHLSHGRTAAEDQHGTDGFKQFVTGARTAFPDLHMTVEDQIAEGDKVVTRWTFHGTQKGELKMGPAPALPPTGKEVTVTGIGIYRIENGKIRKAGSTSTCLAWSSSWAYSRLRRLERPPREDRAEPNPHSAPWGQDRMHVVNR